jgi:tRNA(Ile)-lysidine synthase
VIAPHLEMIFDDAMEQLSPFEARPQLAVAVSGGSDSLALCLLAHRWAREWGGKVIALTVDHQLRSESEAEAAWVARWAKAQCIEHHLLLWQSEKPRSGVQAAARRARYHLLERWCRDHHVLHLLTGHHGDDQAETIAMRERRGSGSVGLAGMSLVRELGYARLLRPLLGARKTMLVQWLRSQGQDWLEDPSNDNMDYARNALRQAGVAYQPDVMQRYAQVRQKLEWATAEWMARCMSQDKAGWCVTEEWMQAPPEVQRRLWLGLLETVSASPKRLRQEKLRGLVERMQDADWCAATLHGCQLRRDGSVVTVCREGVESVPSMPHISKKRRVSLTTAPFMVVNVLRELGQQAINDAQDVKESGCEQ